MSRSETETGAGEEPGELEQPEGFKPKVKAVLKPKRTEPEDELADEVYSLKDRLDRLEAQKAQSWREVGQKESKPAGTLLDGELTDRMNKTIADYEKSGVKLYKRKLFEEGLEEQLDVLNSTVEIDDAWEKAMKAETGSVLGFPMFWEDEEEAPSVKIFVEHIEAIEGWVWTSERAKYALNRFAGRPDKIDELLKAEPQLHALLDPGAIEMAKRKPKPKPKAAEEEENPEGEEDEDVGLLF